MIADIITNDFNALFTILIVPKFDKFMLKLLNSINGSGVFNAYQVLNSLLIKNQIKKDEIPSYLEQIDKVLIKTFVMYFEAGMNFCSTA